jgi:hypothetical protein
MSVMCGDRTPKYVKLHRCYLQENNDTHIRGPHAECEFLLNRFHESYEFHSCSAFSSQKFLTEQQSISFPRSIMYEKVYAMPFTLTLQIKSVRLLKQRHTSQDGNLYSQHLRSHKARQKAHRCPQ